MAIYLQFSLLLFLQIFIRSNSDTEFEGAPCTLGGTRNYAGECRRVQNCPAALSSLRSGLVPNTCVYVDRKAIVCCETEPRISIKKCMEYLEIAKMNEKASSSSNGPTPLLLLRKNKLPQGRGKRANPGPFSSTSHPLLFIVGGSFARMGQFPHMVELGFRKTSSKNISWLCGGTLISDRFVLTAAHCLQHNKGTLTSILVGDVNLQEDSTNLVDTRAIIPIDNFIIHPNYSTTSKYNDIGLIKLKNNVTFSEQVKPACLPQPEERLELQTGLMAHGWGLTEFAGSPSDILQFVELKRYGMQRCKNEYVESSKYEILSSQFCAGAGDENEEAKDTCEGDSGSGLTTVGKHPSDNFTPHFVLGVTSFGPKYCGLSTPGGVYTNVQAFLDWIEGIVWPL